MRFDLLPFTKHVRQRTDGANQQELWCPIRKTWLVSQPEEWVRQAFIHFLLERGFSPNLMQVERKVGPTKDRLDLLILDRTAAPYLLVEVKAPGIDLIPAVRQLARYNRFWKAPYTAAINGQDALIHAVDWESEKVSVVENFQRILTLKNTED